MSKPHNRSQTWKTAVGALVLLGILLVPVIVIGPPEPGFLFFVLFACIIGLIVRFTWWGLQAIVHILQRRRTE